jgi:carbonic anhydrase/acetyltransferase-like protein (isoleucine patch superfamily)
VDSSIAPTAIVSGSIRVRHPEHFFVGDHSIVDDFCYFSTRVRIGRFSHVANGCSVGGGADHEFRLGDYSSLSAGVRVWCASDDFARSLVFVPPRGLEDVKEFLITGDVSLGRCTAVGANSVIMPSNAIPEGTVIGALSFVPPNFAFEPWSVYAGTPIKYFRPRDRAAVIGQLERLKARVAAWDDGKP